MGWRRATRSGPCVVGNPFFGIASDDVVPS